MKILQSCIIIILRYNTEYCIHAHWWSFQFLWFGPPFYFTIENQLYFAIVLLFTVQTKCHRQSFVITEREASFSGIHFFNNSNWFFLFPIFSFKRRDFLSFLFVEKSMHSSRTSAIATPLLPLYCMPEGGALAGGSSTKWNFVLSAFQPILSSFSFSWIKTELIRNLNFLERGNKMDFREKLGKIISLNNTTSNLDLHQIPPLQLTPQVATPLNPSSPFAKWAMVSWASPLTYGDRKSVLNNTQHSLKAV